MREYDVIIYGAYGYTGSLIVRECKSTNLKVLLSGRNPSKLKKQSDDTGYPFEACDVHHPSALATMLKKAKMIIHCAGPFRATAKQMVEACLESSAHYLDITGEYPVFEMLAGYHSRAKDSGILVMPGVGFDVVPSDCLAVHLKKRMPGASHLQLAFTMSKGGVSRGTARTMIEGLGYGSMIRRNGHLTPIALGELTREVDFGGFRRKTLCIPWGDIATAWRSTGIPNIEVYSAVPGKMIWLAKMSKAVNWLLRQSWLKKYLKNKVDSRPPGPDDEKLHKGKSYLWGRVQDGKGASLEARLQTVNGYLLTARMAKLIAHRLTSSDVQPGYYTPAQYFGEELILEMEGSAWM